MKCKVINDFTRVWIKQCFFKIISLLNFDLEFYTQYNNDDKLFFIRLLNKLKYIVKAFNLLLDNCSYLFIMCLVFMFSPEPVSVQITF